MVQSIGESTYKELTLQFTGRNVWGMQFDFAYTLGKSEDNAPITSALSVQGDAGRADPDSLDCDWGRTSSTSATPSSAASWRGRTIDGGNGDRRRDRQRHHFGLAMQFASGVPVNLRSNPAS